MTRTNKTRSALFTSILSLLLCVSMLVGTTFAWFTDTASTSVNSIQSGKLDVVLEMATEWDANGNPTKWESAEGKTLSFRKNTGAPAGEKLLWEPGCTYKLPELRFTNNGNLKLKYQLVITGINGDAELNEAIDWTITHNGSTNSLVNENGTPKDFPMEPQQTVELTISGHMRENAGNKYQGLSIDGISITVYATQLGGAMDGVNGEYDSNNNTYDQNAEYPMHFEPTLKDEAMTKTENGYTYTNSANTVTAQTNAAVVNDSAVPGVQLKKIDTTNTGNIVVTNNQDSFAYDISISNLKENEAGKLVDNDGNATTSTITFTASANLEGVVLYHDGVAMTAADSADAVNAAEEFHYDATTGVVTICVDHFSNFTIVYDLPVAYNQADTLYTSVKDALEDTASTTVTLSADCNLQEVVNVTGTVTLNMNGKTLNLTGPAVINVRNTGNLTVTGNGKMTQDEDSTIGYLFCGYDNAVLTIENGSYDAGLTVVQLSDNSTLNIKDGLFSAWSTYQNKYWVLNAIDSSANTVTWNIEGGSFKNFDPANGKTENPEMSFLNKNHQSTANGEWFVVTKTTIQDDGDGNLTVEVGSMTDLQAAFEAAAKAAANGNKSIEITLEKDFDCTGWTAFSPKGYSGVASIVVNGNGHTLTNLSQPLMIGSFSGAGSITINNLTIENATIERVSYNNLGLGAFVAYSDASGGVVLNNCHLKNSTVNCIGSDESDDDNGYAGGLIGYTSSALTVTNCSVTENCKISGWKSVGAIVGHGSANVTVDGCTVSDCTISETLENRTSAGAGAIAGRMSGGTLTLKGTITVKSNTINQGAAYNGGAVNLYTALGTPVTTEATLVTE